MPIILWIIVCQKSFFVIILFLFGKKTKINVYNFFSDG